MNPANVGAFGGIGGVRQDGAVRSDFNVARTVVTLQSGTRWLAYAAIENVGLMMVDIGLNIPTTSNTDLAPEPYAPGSYVDVVAANGHLIAIDQRQLLARYLRYEPRPAVFIRFRSPFKMSTAWPTGKPCRSISTGTVRSNRTRCATSRSSVGGVASSLMSPIPATRPRSAWCRSTPKSSRWRSTSRSDACSWPALRLPWSASTPSFSSTYRAPIHFPLSTRTLIRWTTASPGDRRRASTRQA